MLQAAGGIKKFVELNFQGIVRMVWDSGGNYAIERS